MADIAKFYAPTNALTAFDPTPTTGNMTTGAASQTVDMTGLKDEEVMIYIINTSATGGDDVLVTVAAGNHPNSKGTTVYGTVGDSESAFIGPLNSMDYLQVSGSNKGKIVITAAKATAEGTGLATDIKLCAVIVGKSS